MKIALICEYMPNGHAHICIHAHMPYTNTIRIYFKPCKLFRENTSFFWQSLRLCTALKIRKGPFLQTHINVCNTHANFCS